MIRLFSSRNPAYGVGIHSETEYGLSGAGWFMFFNNPENTLTPREVEEQAGKAVKEELRYKGDRGAWPSTPWSLDS
jgi:hypothetical protein